MTRVFFNVFPKSGTGLLHAIRGVKQHVNMFDERGEWRTAEDYIRRVFEAGDQCTGHVPYSHKFHAALKRENYRIVFIFRNLRDAVCSLVDYIGSHEGAELNVVTASGVRLSRCEDPILAVIDVIADWWAHFEPWMQHADALYTYRELRGAAPLMGREEESFTFARGNINEWQRQFKPHHIEAAAEKLPDVLWRYNLPGWYEQERMTA